MKIIRFYIPSTVVNTNAEINFLKKVLNNVPDIVFLDHN